MTLFEEYRNACQSGDVKEINRLTVEGLKVEEPHIVSDVVDNYFMCEEAGDVEAMAEIRGMLMMIGLTCLLED